jgi:hypothetical protein
VRPIAGEGAFAVNPGHLLIPGPSNMADHSHSTTMDTGEVRDAENLPEHQRTYKGFLRLAKIGIVIVAILLIFLFWLFY